MDDYLLDIEESARSALQHIRDLVKAVVPEAEEGRSYGMPALRYNKRPLLGFVAAKGPPQRVPLQSGSHRRAARPS